MTTIFITREYDKLSILENYISNNKLFQDMEKPHMLCKVGLFGRLSNKRMSMMKK